jgi:signal transduction histidine kinase
MKRVVVPAVIAIVILAGVAAGVWFALRGSIAGAVTEQARLAGELLDAHVPVNESLVRSLVRPGLHVVLFDQQAGVVIASEGGGIAVHPLPPDGIPAPGGPPERPAPPPDAPGGAAPNTRPPNTGPPRSGPFAAFATALLHVSPVRVARGGQAIDVAPDPGTVATWLAFDLAGFALAALIVAALATARAFGFARAERDELEASIAERRAEAERYQRFFAETGHELRTPLTVMTGYVDILRGRTAIEPLDARILDGLHAETARMRVLVEKMLTLARLESHAAVPRLLDVASAAREAAATLQRRYPERTIGVTADESGSIVIDADDFSAAVGNLLENAVKYAPGSAIEIETAIRAHGVTTAVIDHGPGIDAAERKAIFDRFYRGRGSTHGEGLGLGLAIVKRIADRWNGTIECESAPGRTVFALTFPLADEES